MENLSRREREKQTKKDDIIAAAEKLFYKNGYENTSVDEIAKEAEFTKRTLYKYFVSKEDLFFAVVHKAFKKMVIFFQKAHNEGKNSYEKLRLSCLAYYDFYKKYPDTFKLMNYVGYVKNKGTIQYKNWLEFDNKMFEKMAISIDAGKKDGSIRNDINSELTAYTIAFIMTGLFRQLTETGETFTKHFNLDIEKFSYFSIDLILDSIKAK